MQRSSIRAVGFLQNSWSPVYGGGLLGGHWTRDNWLYALERSRTGQRLKLLRCPEVEIWYDESTPVIAGNARDVMPADLDYMRKVLNEQKPDVIITFGAPAGIAMGKIRSDYQQPWMLLPHPAYRLVTNELFAAALHQMRLGFSGTIGIQQKRGGNYCISVINEQAKMLL